MTGIWAHARYQWQRHGWLPAAGLVMIALAAALQLFVTLPLRARTDGLRQELATARARAAAPAAAQDDQQARLAVLLHALPAADAAPLVVASVHAASVRHGGDLARAEFRLLRDGDAPWQRYQVTVPLRSAYPQVRAWMAEVLEAWPSAALEELSLRRDNADQEVLEARVRLSIYLRAP